MKNEAQFTKRETEVFNLVIKGHTNKVMAHMLGVTDKTIEAHRASIMRKTGANGLAGLISFVKIS